MKKWLDKYNAAITCFVLAVLSSANLSLGLLHWEYVKKAGDRLILFYGFLIMAVGWFTAGCVVLCVKAKTGGR